MAYAFGFLGIVRRMWVTGLFTTRYGGASPQAERIATLYHEARHTEWTHLNWNHTYCLDTHRTDSRGIPYGVPELDGVRACDETVYGAYGLEAVMMASLRKHCANCSGKFRTDAGFAAAWIFPRIVNEDARELMHADGLFDRN